VLSIPARQNITAELPDSVKGVPGLGNLSRQAVMGLMVIEPLPDIRGEGYEVGLFSTESCKNAFSASQKSDLHKADSARSGKEKVCVIRMIIATLLCGSGRIRMRHNMFAAHPSKESRQ
jgi:hypothetical protein